MKELIVDAVNSYLDIFSNEGEKLSLLIDFLDKSNEVEVYDWNNVNGHVTVGAFIYSEKDDKFLVLYHKDLDMFLYPGGHIDSGDKSLLDALYREVYEECGIKDLKLFDICSNGMPFDIDCHIIPYNERVGMAEHYHFDFRYLYCVDRCMDIDFDRDEMSSYKWVSSKDLVLDKNFGSTVKKLIDIKNREVK